MDVWKAERGGWEKRNLQKKKNRKRGRVKWREGGGKKRREGVYEPEMYKGYMEKNKNLISVSLNI